METRQILYDSPEAAHIATVTGWVSRLGHFFGPDGEHMARYDGCTHRRCETEGCEAIIPRHSSIYCDECNRRKTEAQNAKCKRREYKGEPVFHQASGDFYYDSDALEMGLDAEDFAPGDVFLFGEPEYPQFLDADHFADATPEDQELPADIEAAMDAFNAVIQGRRDRNEPTCWTEGNVIAVIDWADFRAVTSQEFSSAASGERE
mgnify:CR=1 FL=1